LCAFLASGNIPPSCYVGKKDNLAREVGYPPNEGSFGILDDGAQKRGSRNFALGGFSEVRAAGSRAFFVPLFTGVLT